MYVPKLTQGANGLSVCSVAQGPLTKLIPSQSSPLSLNSQPIQVREQGIKEYTWRENRKYL